MVVENNPFFSSSASANRLISLILGLVKHDVKFHLVITNGFQTLTEFKEMGISGVNSIYSYQYTALLFENNIWFRRFNRFIIIPLFGNIFNYLAIRCILKHQPNIIWTSMELSSLNLMLDDRLNQYNFKFFTEMSEFLDIHHVQKSHFIHKRIGNKREQLFNQSILPKLNGLALMTSTLMKEFKEKDNLKLLHLPMTVDLDRFNQALPKMENFEQPYIAFVGVMNDSKDGVNILIQAFANIATKFSNHTLYLIGGWNYDTPAHLEMIKNLNLDGRVNWLGEFPRGKIPAILQKASLLVLPRPDSKQAQGGFPTKLGEYLASGVPVCATTVGEIPDYLTDNETVFFAEPGSIDSFANALDRALSNPELAQKVGIAGRNIAEVHFNKDIQAKKLNEFFKKLYKTTPFIK